MSEETIPELARRMMTDYGFPFLLGWILGAGLGQLHNGGDLNVEEGSKRGHRVPHKFAGQREGDG